jgi:serine/threonine protein kinase
MSSKTSGASFEAPPGGNRGTGMGLGGMLAGMGSLNNSNAAGDDMNGDGECIIVADKYIIQRQIGKGSFGEVYRGYDKDTKELVAIKIVSNFFLQMDIITIQLF